MIQFLENDDGNRRYKIDNDTCIAVLLQGKRASEERKSSLHENDVSLFDTDIEWIKHMSKRSYSRVTAKFCFALTHLGAGVNAQN